VATKQPHGLLRTAAIENLERLRFGRYGSGRSIKSARFFSGARHQPSHDGRGGRRVFSGQDAASRKEAKMNKDLRATSRTGLNDKRGDTPALWKRRNGLSPMLPRLISVIAEETGISRETVTEVLIMRAFIAQELAAGITNRTRKRCSFVMPVEEGIDRFAMRSGGSRSARFNAPAKRPTRAPRAHLVGESR